MSEEKINLNLNEENELCFELVIEGTTTNNSMDKPIMRFQIEESNSGGMSYVFPVNKSSDGSLRVLIPKLENLVKEEKVYKGSLEVIIGGQYFVPQTVNIGFTKPLRVESKVVSVNKSTDSLSEISQKPKVSAKISSPSSKQLKEDSRKPTIKKQLSDYSQEEQSKIRQEMIKRKKLQEQQNFIKQKNVIKNLLSDALDDFDILEED